MLAAKLRHRHTAFGLPQDREDLFIGAYAAPSGATVPSSSVYLLVFIQNLLVHLAKKILLMQPLTFGGDYPLLITSTSTSAFAEHFQVADAARTPAGASADNNQSGNASAGYEALSKNPKADEAADKG